MGYTTEFEGQVKIEPPLSSEEVAYLQKFNGTRRMYREKGPYYVGGSGSYGQGHDEDIHNYNGAPPGQPNLWCQWQPTDDGTAIMWDEGEKFNHSLEWMSYLIDHFIGSNPRANSELPFLVGHTCNGEIVATGEDTDDNWKLVVENNVVSRLEGRIIYE